MHFTFFLFSRALDDPIVPGRRQHIEAWHLGFALVGGLLDAIIRSQQTTVDCAVLFVQLVTAGAIGFSNNTKLLQYMTLLHSTREADARSERGEDEKKFYQNLIMKIKKEMTKRKVFSSIQPLKQFLPLPKTSREFVSCESLWNIKRQQGIFLNQTQHEKMKLNM